MQVTVELLLWLASGVLFLTLLGSFGGTLYAYWFSRWCARRRVEAHVRQCHECQESVLQGKPLVEHQRCR